MAPPRGRPGLCPPAGGASPREGGLLVHPAGWDVTRATGRGGPLGHWSASGAPRAKGWAGRGRRSSRPLSPHSAQPLSGSWPQGQESRACLLCCSSIVRACPPQRSRGSEGPPPSVRPLSSILTASVAPQAAPCSPVLSTECQPHTAQTSDPLQSPQKRSGYVEVAAQAGKGSPRSAVSAASIWGLAGPEPMGWADWELRLALEWAPRSAQGYQARFKVSGPHHPQPCTWGALALPHTAGGQPCRNLRGNRPPTASSLLRGSAQLCLLEKPTPAHPTLSLGRGPAPSALKLFLGFSQSLAAALRWAAQSVPPAQVPRPRGSPALPPPPGLAHGVWVTCCRPWAAGGRTAAPARRRPAVPPAWRPKREVADTQNKTCRVPLTSAPALWRCLLMGALLPRPRPLSGQPPSSAGRAGSLQGRGVPTCG